LLAKKTIRSTGIAFTTLFFVCAITAIVLAGITYKYAGPDWKEFVWTPLPALMIAAIVYTFVIVIFGYVAFLHPNIGCSIAYSIFLFISILFNMAIAIYALVAANYGWVNTYFGCNGQFEGVMSSWRGIDLYLQKVDQGLCSPQCPCYFTNTTGYVNNETIAPYYNQWTKSNVPPGNTAFQNCSSQVQTNAYQQAAAGDAYFDPEGQFDSFKFSNYMAEIENDFQCAGWCNVTYYNPDTQNNMVMFKYMFTDINRGPPNKLGCLDSIIEWLPPYLNAWGAVTLALATFQIITFVMTICQCWAREKDHEHQIPHHHDDNRK